MADRRSGGPGGASSRRPAPSTRSRSTARTGSRTPASVARPAPRPGQSTARGRSVAPRTPSRARFTSRAAILVLVVAVLVVSYASSLRAYLEQRDHIRAVRAEVAKHEAEIRALEREADRWKDPAFIKAQARERLLYVMPGEVGYQVIDANGKPLDPVDSLSTPVGEEQIAADEWWANAWQSVVIAGNPPQSLESN